VHELDHYSIPGIFFENIFSFAVKDYTFVLSDVCWPMHLCDN